jgi:hypothetical protein
MKIQMLLLTEKNELTIQIENAPLINKELLIQTALNEVLEALKSFAERRYENMQKTCEIEIKSLTKKIPHEK